MSNSMQTSSDRRSELRIDAQATILLEVMSASYDNSSPAKVIICNSLDISANGIQIELDDKIAVGSILRLGVDLGRDIDTLYLVGEARWVHRDSEQYKVGFELYDAEGTDIANWKQTIADRLNAVQQE